MKEFEIRDEIIAFLEAKGIACWKDPKPAFKPGKRAFKKSNGVPDILGYLHDGTFLGIEVKTPEGRISPEQREFMERAKSKGCMVFVARSIDDVIKRFP